MADELKPASPIEMFISYAHNDEKLRGQLMEHLANLSRQGVISAWHDRKIPPGSEWHGEIDKHLDAAKVILLLISPSFMASEYCNGIEVDRAMERHASGKANVIPVILKPVDWMNAPFSKLQALPKDAKPVTRWTNRDSAFLNVVDGIRTIIKEVAASNDVTKTGVKSEVEKPSPAFREKDPGKKSSPKSFFRFNFELRTPDGLRYVVFCLERNVHEDETSWMIDFQLFERQVQTKPFEKAIIVVRFELNKTLNPKAEKIANVGLSESQSHYALHEAANAAKATARGEVGMDTAKREIERTLKR